MALVLFSLSNTALSCAVNINNFGSSGFSNWVFCLTCEVIKTKALT